MKTRSIILGLLSLAFCHAIFAQVGIGTTNPDGSSILDIASIDKGILIPRMTAIERLSIATPIADGLMVYQIDDIKGFYYYDATASAWDRVLKQSRDAIPVGSIFTFPMATIPTGYLVCDGSAISRTTYADLFAILGTTYGAGDGSTTFNIPDYRGQFLRGLDNGSGNDPDAATRQDRGDGTTGDFVGTIQNDDMESHIHDIDPPSTISNSAGNHNHSTSIENISTFSGGSHNHSTYTQSLSTNNTPNHRHIIRGERRSISTAFGSTRFIADNTGPDNIYTQYDGSHNHSLTLPSLTTNSAGNHVHNLIIPALNTNSSGLHAHDTDIPLFSSSPAGASENRPINISVVYCIKY